MILFFVIGNFVLVCMWKGMGRDGYPKVYEGRVSGNQGTRSGDQKSDGSFALSDISCYAKLQKGA